MYPAAIEDYVRPATVAEALAALGKYEAGDALMLAGGQSAMQAVKTRLLRPRCVIDLQAVAELQGVSTNGALRIGPMTRYAALAKEGSFNGAYQALNDAAARIGDRQVRNRGTIGGSLCWNYVAACLPPVALALGMEMELTGPNGSRTLAADDFIGGPLETAREDDEILVSLNLAAPPAHTGSAYKKWGLVTDALPGHRRPACDRRGGDAHHRRLRRLHIGARRGRRPRRWAAPRGRGGKRPPGCFGGRR